MYISCSIIESYVIKYFLSEPTNEEVCIGETAYFDCDIDKWDYPQWYINSTIYQSYKLPPKHFYDGIMKRMIVSNVTLIQNNTTYQCFFVKLSDGRRQQYNSTLARLIVHLNGKVCPSYMYRC